jgi:integral membrane sensor domain MASE1
LKSAVSRIRESPWARAALFSAASNAGVLFVIEFGQIFWPERLPANSQHIFWLASGVNVAGLLILGLRYWPVILLDAFPAWLISKEPLEATLVGAGCNALEALLGAWIILRLGRYAGRFDRLWPVGGLILASILAPLANTLIIPAYFCLRGMMTWADYDEALANWSLANAASILVLTPLLLTVWRRDWRLRERHREFAGLLVASLVLGLFAFKAVFGGMALNFAFLSFLGVMYAAVRFSAAEVSATLGVFLLTIYITLGLDAHSQAPGELARAIWFVQAYCWVMASTGLLLAALSDERRRAELSTLEASLKEERARLTALRYQVNPHFLFNSLNSIRAVLPDSDQVPRDMVTNLAGYLRSTLEVSDNDLIPLRSEVASMEQYLAIEKVRYGQDLQVEIAVGEGIRELMVPVFLLQPLVENAIQHGLIARPGEFQLRIGARLEGARLNLEVANTGEWKGPRTGGLGLANIRQRLKLLYGSDDLLDIEDQAGWVRVRVSIPL